MMKLKLGLFNKDLAMLFCISLSTVSRIFMAYIYIYISASHAETTAVSMHKYFHTEMDKLQVFLSLFFFFFCFFFLFFFVW